MVRYCDPAFIFTVRSVDIDSRILKHGQLVNHYGKARSFTTKVRAPCGSVGRASGCGASDPGSIPDTAVALRGPSGVY